MALIHLTKNKVKKIPKIGVEAPENKADNQVATNSIPSDNQVAPQDSIGKYSIELDKSSLELDNNKNIVSKYVSMQESACTRERESYEDIMDNLCVEEEVRPILWEFIKHCQANGHTLINSKLESIIMALDFTYKTAWREKIASLKRAISGGHFDILENKR